MSGKYHDYFSDRDIESLNAVFEDSWQQYCDAINAVARFSFCFTIVLLAYCGIESHTGFRNMPGLIITDIIFIVYCLVAVTAIRLRFLRQTYVLVVLTLIMLTVLFIFGKPGMYPCSLLAALPDDDMLIILTVIMTFGGLFVIILRHLIDELYYRVVWNDMGNAGALLSDLLAFSMSSLISGGNSVWRRKSFYVKQSNVLKLGIDCNSVAGMTNSEFIGIINGHMQTYIRGRMKIWMLPLHRRIFLRLRQVAEHLFFCFKANGRITSHPCLPWLTLPL